MEQEGACPEAFTALDGKGSQEGT